MTKDIIVPRSIIDDILLRFDQPEGILLSGSRATGDHLPFSDWEFWVLGGTKPAVNNKVVDKHHLDISWLDKFNENTVLRTKGWVPDNKAITIYDKTDGVIDSIMKKTNQAYEDGPEPMSSESTEAWRSWYERTVAKFNYNLDEPQQNIYLSRLYLKTLTEVWFRLRNEWSLPVYQALPYIKEKDSRLYSVAVGMLSGKSQSSRIDNAKKLVGILFNKGE